MKFDFIVEIHHIIAIILKINKLYKYMAVFYKTFNINVAKKWIFMFIIPSIWMKNTHIFNYMLKYNIHKIFTLSSTETKKVFHGEAQVPTCYFLLENKQNSNNIKIYDKIYEKYIKFTPINCSLPVYAVSIIKKLQPFVKKYGYLKVEKTNIRPERVKNLTLSDVKTDDCKYANVYTCKLTKQKPYLCLIIQI